MAFDIIRGKTTARDWSCGAFTAETFWGPAKMEAKAAEFMSKPKGPFGLGGKPTKEEATKMVAEFMKANKIGISKTDSGVGSVLFPAKEQKKMMDKIDDLRFDIRGARSVVGAGVFALSGALAFVAISKIYKASKLEGR